MAQERSVTLVSLCQPARTKDKLRETDITATRKPILKISQIGALVPAGMDLDPFLQTLGSAQAQYVINLALP